MYIVYPPPPCSGSVLCLFWYKGRSISVYTQNSTLPAMFFIIIPSIHCFFILSFAHINLYNSFDYMKLIYLFSCSNFATCYCVNFFISLRFHFRLALIMYFSPSPSSFGIIINRKIYSLMPRKVPGSMGCLLILFFAEKVNFPLADSLTLGQLAFHNETSKRWKFFENILKDFTPGFSLPPLPHRHFPDEFC